MPSSICPVCHREYEYTNARYDRCPYCVPKDKPERDDYDYNQDYPTDESDESTDLTSLAGNTVPAPEVDTCLRTVRGMSREGSG
jgi:hypothetical protein